MAQIWFPHTSGHARHRRRMKHKIDVGNGLLGNFNVRRVTLKYLDLAWTQDGQGYVPKSGAKVI